VSQPIERLRYILNTFFVVIALLYHSIAGYTFTRLRFPSRQALLFWLEWLRKESLGFEAATLGPLLKQTLVSRIK
jgi:hypothetical protein